MTCPNCNAERLSDSAQFCSNCGRSLLRRPRAELVPPVRAERFQSRWSLAGSGLLRFSSSAADAGKAGEMVIETQWTRIEKVSFARALFARLSEHLAKSSAALSPEEAALESASRGPEPPPDRYLPSARILIVNRAQVVTSDCTVCGGGFAATPMGERLLLADVKETLCYLLCANCGDQIVSHVKSLEAAQHYTWDWAIPVRRGLPTNTSAELLETERPAGHSELGF